MNRNLCLAAFAAGAIAVAWVGAGYLGGHPLALAMTVLIGATYVIGTLELKRFHDATVTFDGALVALQTTSTADAPDKAATTPEELDTWLSRLPASLQNAVRLRLDGERAPLPGPALTPYLVGLLVMLGMLGTFLGMVVTLNGAVLALETTTDLPTIRAALAAPVKGLGLAFGTSVAGVAASAMLGLISSLCRRERTLVGQRLDAALATSLRRFSLAHQRQETFRALQAQSESLPRVAEQLAVLVAQMERQQAQSNERLLASQERFHGEAQAVYGELARSVDRSLKESLSESARLAGATIQPAVDAAMSGLARETAALHAHTAAMLNTQLDGLSARFDRSVGEVVAAQARHHETIIERQRQALDAFAQSAAQNVADSTANLTRQVADAQAALRAELVAHEAQRLEAQTAALTQLGGTLRDEWQAAGVAMLAGQQEFRRTLEAAAERDHQRAENLAAQTLAGMTALAQSAQAAPQAAAELIAAVRTLQSELASRDEVRDATLTLSLQAMATELREEWQAATAHGLAQQQQICRTLEGTAQGIAENAQTHARQTIDEIARLMQTAAEAPRVAAEVIGQLRQQLSDSVARDNALLDERSRMMETLNTLLDGINRASSEQRGAIEALVAATASTLDAAVVRFADDTAARSTQLVEAAAGVTGSAVEVASLGEAFGFAVQQFGETSGKLVASFERIESALEKSMARSDEQLAYYVAQARELIDLSLLSQKQAVDQLQQIAGRAAAEVC